MVEHIYVTQFRKPGVSDDATELSHLMPWARKRVWAHADQAHRKYVESKREQKARTKESR